MSNAPHILITDDDRQIRTSLARFLTRNGFRVSGAEDGVAMFAAVDNGRFDLVVLDIMMPGEDGLSLCRRFRAASRMPVVLLTALAGETDRIVGLEIGADDYICKPFNPRELLARIRAVLRRTGEMAGPGEREKTVLYQFEAGARHCAAHAAQSGRRPRRADCWRIRFAPGFRRASPAGADPRSSSRSDARQGILGLRPQYRRAGQQASPENRSRSAGSCTDQNGAERRLCVLRGRPGGRSIRREFIADAVFQVCPPFRLGTRIALMMLLARSCRPGVVRYRASSFIPARLMMVYSAHWLIERADEAALAIFKADAKARDALSARFGAENHLHIRWQRKWDVADAKIV